MLGEGKARPSEAEPRTGLRGALGTHRAGFEWRHWSPVVAAGQTSPQVTWPCCPPLGHPRLQGPGTPMGHNGQPSPGTSEYGRRAAPLVDSAGGTIRPSLPLLPLVGGVQAQVTPGGAAAVGRMLLGQRISGPQQCPTEVGLPPTPWGPGPQAGLPVQAQQEGGTRPASDPRRHPQGQLLGPRFWPWQGL